MIVILIGTLSEAESELVNELFQKHHIKFYNISRSILRSHDDAEDAVSQAFLRMINFVEKISQLPDEQMLPYCIVIVKNEANNIIKKQKSISRLEDDLIKEGHDLFEDPLLELFPEDDDIKARLKAALNELPEEERLFVNLRFSNNTSYRDLGELWGISEAAAKMRIGKIVKKLRIFCEEGRA